MRCSCLRLLFLLFGIFIFGKIYQHNQVVRLRYQAQRLERAIQNLREQKNKALIVQSQVGSYEAIERWACGQAGMQEVSLANVRDVFEGAV